MENDQKPMDIDFEKFDASQEISLLKLASKAPHIIAEVFAYLELNDRLNLASTCKQLNNLHNSQPELCGKIWLNSNAAASCEFPLSRQYSNVKLLDLDFKLTNRPSPADLLKPYAVKLTELQVIHRAIDEDGDDSSYDVRIKNPAKLLELIPFFSHLTYLDLLSGRQLQYLYLLPEFGPNVPPAAEIITMPNLQHLKVGFELFASLHRDFIDFSQCRRLVSLDVQSQACSLADVRHDRMHEMLELMPKLFKQQDKLKSLKIEFHHCVRLFDNQLSLASGAHQLEKFKFVDYAVNSATAVQQMNLLDFMETYVQEGKSKFDIRGDGLNPAKVETSLSQFIAKNLDMPYETLGIVCDRVADVSNIPKESKKYYQFTGVELRRIFRSPIIPNPATINLDLFLAFKGNGRIKDLVISAGCVKYQNLHHLAISLGDSALNLAPLNSLVHLRSLELNTFGRIGTCLRDISIAGLDKFKIDTHTSDVKHRHFVQLLNFIDRHRKLTNFYIGISPIGIWYERNQHVTKKFYDDCFYLLNSAMKNLRELDMMTCSSTHDLKEKVPDRFRATTHLLLDVYTKTGFTFKFKHRDYEMTFTKTAKDVDEKTLFGRDRIEID